MAGTARKRTKEMNEHDLAKVAELVARGRTHTEITEIINRDRPPEYRVTRQQISYDVKRIMDGWRQSASEDADVWRGRLIGQLAAVQREAWDAWERSKQPKERTVTKRAERPGGEDAGPLVIGSAESHREQQIGNPSYLDVVVRCSERMAKLLGLDAREYLPDLGRLHEEAARYGAMIGKSPDEMLALVQARRVVNQRWSETEPGDDPPEDG